MTPVDAGKATVAKTWIQTALVMGLVTIVAVTAKGEVSSQQRCVRFLCRGRSNWSRRILHPLGPRLRQS